MVDREACIQRAAQLGGTYYAKYHNCAQASFGAIMDALRKAGIHLTSPEAEEVLFRGLSGLSGGHANLGCGNCGALTGAAMAMSLVAGVGPEEQSGKDKNRRWIAFDNVAKTVGARFKKEYYGITCKHVTWERYGMWWNFWDPQTNEHFLNEMKDGGCLTGSESTIARAAAWGVACVLEEMEHPRTVDQVVAEHKLAKVDTNI